MVVYTSVNDIYMIIIMYIIVPGFKLVESTHREILEKPTVILDYNVAVTNSEVEGSGEGWKEGGEQRIPHLMKQRVKIQWLE